MNTLLDTDVLVDCLRGTPAARAWLEQASGQAFQIPGIAAMELIWGCRDREDLNRCRKFLDKFSVAWPEPDEFIRGFDLLTQYRLSHGLSVPDALMAGMAITRAARLFSFNLKHYRFIPGLDVQQPYDREPPPDLPAT